MSRIINVGRVTSYAEAVAGGYTGTREEWEIILANLGTTAAEVEANRQAVAEDKAAVERDVTTVGEYKDTASAAAAAALQSAESAHTDALAATAAKEAAQTAQGIAEEAKEAAVSAKTSAESAQSAADTSAEAAAESALAAQNAATTATTQAGAASDSATAAAASAASVDGVVAEITAAKTEAITAIETKGAETLDSIPDDYTELSGDVDDLKSAVAQITPIINSASGVAVTISDGADNVPARALSVALKFSQEGTGSPSPQNIRPISGINQVTISRETAAGTSTWTVAFPSEAGTVYGGTLDVTTGTLTVYREMITLDGTEDDSKYSFGSSAQGYVQFYKLPKKALAVHSDLRANMVASDKLRLASSGAYANMPYNSWKNNTTDLNLQLFDHPSSRPTIADVKNTIAGMGGISFVYLLAEPIIYHCDPVTINTAYGQNIISADDGELTLSYVADAKLYIDGRVNATRNIIAGIEADDTASHAYDVGDMLIMGDDLYRVIAVIANGGRITVGTNVTKTTVAEQLIALANA